MLDERVAVLETKVNTLTSQNDEILNKLDNINEALLRQKGFVAGVVFVVTAVVTVVGYAIDLLFKR